MNSSERDALIEAPGVRGRDDRVAGDGDERSHRTVARRLDFVGERSHRELAENFGEAADATLPAMERDPAPPAAHPTSDQAWSRRARTSPHPRGRACRRAR